MTSHVKAQYSNSDKLQARIDTHQQYTVGPALEPLVDEVLQLHGNEDILDVGCGPGTFLGRLASNGHRAKLVGLDYSAGMVEQASRDFPDVQFQQGDAQALPFADASFDLVTARHMLYHVPDVLAALREARRVLRPAGVFVAVTNAAGYMTEWWEAYASALAGRHERHSDSLKFTEQDGLPLLEQVFGKVDVTFGEAALVFPTPEATLPYFRSLFDTVPSPQDEADFLAEVARRTGSEGWRVSKRVVVLRARC